jgi:multidrug resistance protein, MATE family
MYFVLKLFEHDVITILPPYTNLITELAQLPRMASNVSETTALLSHDTAIAHDEEASTLIFYTKTDAESDSKLLTTGIQTTRIAEAKHLIRTSAPLMLTSVLQYSYNVTTVIVAGHLGLSELGAVSLATMIANVTGLAIYEGLATSLDTLCSQAYGSHNLRMVGLHMQRMIYFLWLVTIPIGVMWACSPWIISAIVPERDLAVLAGAYLKIYLIGAPGFATFEAGKRFVQAQGMFIPPLFILLLCAPLNLLLNWVFVWVSEAWSLVTVEHKGPDCEQKYDWGLQGAAAATSITNLLQPILLLLYVRFAIPSSLRCWPGLSREAFKNWGPMIRLAVQGVIMVEAEWLAFDIIFVFASAWLGAKYLAAQSILFNFSILIYHLPFPASIAASTRLGHLIGSGALGAARIAVTTYYIIFVGIGLFDLSFIMAMRNVIPRVFSDDDEVRSIVSTMMPVVALFQLFDSTAALSNGLLRGLGRQNIGGWVNLLVYYLVSHFFQSPLP